MAFVDWELRGPKFAVCNCDFGCPCEFMALPTNGHCEGAEAHLIEKGHFGDVRLDGLIVGALFRYPGPVHEGKGRAQGIIDRRATREQVDALFRILGGEEQEPFTPFNIYGSTIEEEDEPIFADLSFEADIAARTGRFAVDGQTLIEIEPIRNPVTGKPHRARIVLPEGFEFREAEMGSGRVFADGLLKMDFRNSYAALFHAAYGPQGIIDAAA